MTIWVDADSMPQEVRRMIIRFAQRRTIPAYFVANRNIPLEAHDEHIQMIVTGQQEGAADDYIVEHASAGDIAVTRDIPLASRLVEKRLTVCNDRGVTFTEENIREYLSVRNFSMDLVTMGIVPDRTKNYSKKDLTQFANCLERELSRSIQGSAYRGQGLAKIETA
jgi:uncharacterized protein YaiI (UPF0178 family)